MPFDICMCIYIYAYTHIHIGSCAYMYTLVYLLEVYDAILPFSECGTILVILVEARIVEAALVGLTANTRQLLGSPFQGPGFREATMRTYVYTCIYMCLICV